MAAQVFALQVMGPDEGGVSHGGGGMSSSDMWVEPAVAAEVPMPPLWASGGGQPTPGRAAASVPAPGALPAPSLQVPLPGTALAGSGSPAGLAARLSTPGSGSQGSPPASMAQPGARRDWVGGAPPPTSAPAPVPPAPSAAAQPPAAASQAKQESSAGDMFRGEFEELVALGRSLNEGLEAMGASAAQALAQLPEMGRLQRSAAAVAVAAAERAEGVDAGSLARQADTMPGYQVALTTLANFAEEQAALDKQVRATTRS